MNDVLAKALVAEAQGAAPNECCGFVLAGWDHVPIPNCHPDPQRHFQMDDDMLREIGRTIWGQVIGIYHSHPRGSKGPSEFDVGIMKLYAVHDFRFWIVTYNNVYEWRLEDDIACPVRRDGTTGRDLAYPVLAAPAPV